MLIKRGLTSGLLLLTSAGVNAEVFFSEDFTSGSLGLMTPYSAASSNDWSYGSYGDDHYAVMNGYGADAASDDWLITPALPLDNVVDATLSFTTMANYDGGDLVVLMSSDYVDGSDPSSASWTDIAAASAQPELFSAGGFAPVTATGIDLSAFEGQAAHLAFHYTSTGTGGGDGAAWEVVDVSLDGTVTGVLPTAAAIAINNEAPLTDQEIGFEALASHGVAPYTYLWSFGDGTQSTDASATHTYNLAGTYNVSLTVTDADGQTATEQKNLTVIQQVITVIPAQAGDVRIATFNAYLNRGSEGELLSDLNAAEKDAQAEAVAEIIQRIRPDVVLLNEFDYVADGSAIEAFQNLYLKVSHNDSQTIEYPYVYIAESNTGIDSGFDLNNDGSVGGADDAFGYGAFPGQYGMALLSLYPIVEEDVRTFQKFLWKDMPDAKLPADPDDSNADGDTSQWYSDDELAVFRLSSKSHWDIPLDINGKTIHILASHPTPPVFDGNEDRNGLRNHDEIRFWADYVAGESYIYDDLGNTGGLASSEAFVIAGDLNASPYEGDATDNPMALLTRSDWVQSTFLPTSAGGRENAPDNTNSPSHTANWKMRADYVLPSVTGLDVENGAVFWPTAKESLHRLTGHADVISSDHRLVWLDLSLTDTVVTPTATETTASSSSGGGALHPAWLLALISLVRFTRRQR